MTYYLTAVLLIVSFPALLFGLARLGMLINRWRFRSSTLALPDNAEGLDQFSEWQHRYANVTSSSPDVHHYTCQSNDQFFLLSSSLLTLCIKGGQHYPKHFSMEKQPSHQSTSLPEVRFSLEDSESRFGKKIALVSEFQTGDHSFDDQVFIDTVISNDLLRTLLSIAPLRKHVLFLLNSGWNEVVLFGSLTPVSVTATSASTVFHDQSSFDDHLQNIQDLRDSLPSIQVTNPEQMMYHSGDRLLAANSVLALSAVLVFVLGRERWLILDDSFQQGTTLLSIGAWLLSLPLLYLALRGQSSSFKSFSVNSAIGLLTLLLGFNPTIRLINAAFDQSQSVDVVVPILSLEDDVPELPYTYVRVGASPHSPEATLLINRSHLVSEKESIRVRIQNGLLDEPWLVEILSNH